MPATQYVVEWTTDVDSDSRVDYGLDTDYGNFIYHAELTKNHSVTLADLIPTYTYHFKTTSVGVDFNEVSADQTFVTTFTLDEASSLAGTTNSPSGSNFAGLS
ncbi:MAG: hypothetical protein WC455_10075 [Dehalococcoidia bacterium]|jgi:hypothetical protein